MECTPTTNNKPQFTSAAPQKLPKPKAVRAAVQASDPLPPLEQRTQKVFESFQPLVVEHLEPFDYEEHCPSPRKAQPRGTQKKNGLVGVKRAATEKLEEERKVRPKTVHTPVIALPPTLRLFTPFPGGTSPRPLSQLGSPLNFLRRGSFSVSPNPTAFSPRATSTTPHTFENTSRSSSSTSYSVPNNTPVLLEEIREMEE